MDQTYIHQNKKSLTSQLMNMNSQFLKRVITKLLLYVSVFSLFFCHSTCSSLLYNFNFYFSTLPLKLASHTLDKHYAFLICNGLLVFLAKYSGLFSSSSSSSTTSSSSKHVNSTLHEYYSYKSFEDDSRPEMVVMEAVEVPLFEKEAERESTCTHDDEEAQQNEHKLIEVVLTVEPESTTDHHHENFMAEEDRLQGEEAFVEGEEEEGEGEEEELNEEEENGMLSTEELNKKFDEFIWKMKEELRIEAERQLVMVSDQKM